jgi:hypothetical protein
MEARKREDREEMIEKGRFNRRGCGEIQRRREKLDLIFPLPRDLCALGG